MNANDTATQVATMDETVGTTVNQAVTRHDTPPEMPSSRTRSYETMSR
jgi:hypothetical protein